MYRVKDLSWWEEELPTDEEMQHGINVLKENNNMVDFIITTVLRRQNYIL